MNRSVYIKPGMRAAVVGLGRSGRSICSYLIQEGARIMVSDVRTWDQLSAGERKMLEKYGAVYEGGVHSQSFLEQTDMVIISPGVNPDQPVLKNIERAGVPVVGELAVAAGRIKVPVIAISGTNGKTTVTELIGSLLACCGKKVFVGGNIGTPVTDYLLAPDDYDYVVLEVSSFQLERCGDFSADVALLLNISPDHLNRHGTLERYAAAKMNLFRDADKTTHAIINGEDSLIAQYLHYAAVNSFERFGYDSSYESVISAQTISTGMGGRRYCYDLDGCLLDTRIGRLNAAAALLAVEPFALDVSSKEKGLRLFKTGEHRMQWLARVEGVDYINDSKATNSGATAAAIEQCGPGIVLIAGGSEKGDDFALLRTLVQSHVKALILIGHSAGKIARAIGDLVPTYEEPDMVSAVNRARHLSEPGSTVLLSPACASFDMFENYAHRGKMFAAAVHNLKEAAEQEDVS